MPGIPCEECGHTVPDGLLRCPQCGAPAKGVDEDTQQLAREVAEALGPNYEVREKIGRGGYAVVFLVYDRQLDRDLAAKTLIPEFAAIPHLAERFRREAGMVARLNHPNVVPIYFVAGKGKTACCVMPFVEGETLNARIRREGQLAPHVALSLAQDVAAALDVAHSAGFVHRDVKPDNILMEFSSGRAMLADFGIAKALEQDGELTASGVIIGTPAYMSPEQAGGEQEIDGRSDVYSLASVIWQMLVGEPPYGGLNAQIILAQHVSAPIPDLMERREDLGSSAAEVMKRALAKNRGDRFDTAGEFVTRLEAALGAPGLRRSGGTAMANQGASDIALFRTLAPGPRDDAIEALHSAADLASITEASESVVAYLTAAAGRFDRGAIVEGIAALGDKLRDAVPAVRHPLQRSVLRLAKDEGVVGMLGTAWAQANAASQAGIEAAVELLKPDVAETLLRVARRERSPEIILLADRTGVLDDRAAKNLAQDPSASVVQAFVTATSESARPNATIERWLGMAARHPTDGVRKYVAEVAARRGAAVADHVARQLLGDVDTGVRVAAIRALGASRRKEALPDLVRILEAGSVDEQVAAAEGLGKLAHPAVVRPLRRVLERKHLLRLVRGPVQRAAVGALASLPDDLAEGALEALRSDRDAAIRALVADHLES